MIESTGNVIFVFVESSILCCVWRVGVENDQIASVIAVKMRSGVLFLASLV